ncbi:hypothetical protein PTKIN_Ptkin14bG0124800 [Pterospermum kingtungense]
MANSPAQTTSSNGPEASKKACTGCSDRISDLPDHLILQILSFLSTKQAVETSVLSKRWGLLWTVVPTLHLEDSYQSIFDEQARVKFVHFVDKVLFLKKAASVEKFLLDCKSDYWCIDTWICSAMEERSLREVDISVPNYTVEIPSGLFLMKTLKILKLYGKILVDVPVSVCFPSLKILHLRWVIYADVKSLSCLISGCMNLGELRIDTKNKRKKWVHFDISTPTLDSLSLFFEGRCDLRYCDRTVGFFTPSLKYLKLSFSRRGQSDINTWICSTIQPGLQAVDIFVPRVEELKLPSALFLMKTLKILKLHGAIMVDDPVSVCLPSLKVLHLLWVNYADIDSISCFISGCLNLEELRIEAKICLQNIVNIEVSIPTLKKLSLALKYFLPDMCEEKLEINVPALNHLDFSSYGLTPSQHFIENFPCIIEANVSVPAGKRYRIQLFKALNAVKRLRLICHQDFFRLEPNSLFVNLTLLELRGGVRETLVLHFLQNSPKLETLVVHNKVLIRNGGHLWTHLEPVPTCILSSLSMACFELQGLKSELKMVEYILKNARVLRTMEIYTSKMPSDSKLCFLEKISMLPRSSENCQLSFK